MKYPVGVQTFDKIIEGGFSYVDKTALVYKLAHYQAVMYTIFAMLGTDITPELPTSDGRIDMVLKTSDSIYIFELKYGKDAAVALKQIEDKKYAATFKDDKRKKVLVGINFSEDSRTIDDWKLHILAEK